MSEKLVVPVDDASLNLLESALDYHFGSERDENGDPIGVGEFSLYQLLDFWSGYDPTKEEVIDDGIERGYTIVEYKGGPVLTSKDVIQALIEEVRRLRNDHGTDGT